LNHHPLLPVIVLAGFLGSGKTTLLNRLLREGPKTAVLINEFGSTPLDQQLIERQELPLMVLSGGCLCCQIKGALAPNLKNLWMAWREAGTAPFERVIIEASGVASPEPILDTLLRDRWLASRYRLQAVVTTLAIPSALETLKRFPEARAQVAWADVLVLTQGDLAEAGAGALVDEHLGAFAPVTPRLRAEHGAVDTDALERARRAHFRRPPGRADSPDHAFRGLSCYFDVPLPWVQLQSALEELLDRHRGQLVRIKGVVHLPDQVEPVAVHAASGRLYRPTSLPVRPAGDQRSRLVFITAGPADSLARDLNAALSGGGVRIH
jgi:G3E family GTPase